MRALKVGAQQIGQVILSSDSRPFEHYETLAYDNKIERYNSNVAASYQQYIDSINGRANTDFAIVFEEIQRFVNQTHGLESLTVIFFTDGCDTTNQKNFLQDKLA